MQKWMYPWIQNLSWMIGNYPFSNCTFLGWLHVYGRPNNRNPGFRHAWKFELWSKTKRCGTTFRFHEIWALKVPAARVNMGGVGSSWEWEQKPGSFGLGCRPSSVPGSLGTLSGSHAGLMCSSTWCRCASIQTEFWSLFSLEDPTQNRRYWKMELNEPQSFSPALEELRATVFHSLEREAILCVHCLNLQNPGLRAERWITDDKAASVGQIGFRLIFCLCHRFAIGYG